MPPSTASSVRPLAAPVLREPTRYSGDARVGHDRAPGLDDERCGTGRPTAAQRSASRARQRGRRARRSPAGARRRSVTPNPPPRSRTPARRARPIADGPRASARAGPSDRRYGSSVEHLRADVRMQTVEAHARHPRPSRSTTAGASASDMPNFDASWPVAIASWVTTSTSGTTRSRTGWTRPCARAMRIEPFELGAVVDDHERDARTRPRARAPRRSCCCRAARCGRRARPPAGTPPPRRRWTRAGRALRPARSAARRAP